MTRRERARRPLAMDPDLAVLGVLLRLHEVVADLVDELEVLPEHLAERVGDLLVDDEPVQGGVVAAGGHGVSRARRVKGGGEGVATRQGSGEQVVLERARTVGPVRNDAGDHEHAAQLGELGRLERGEAEVDPADRAPLPHAEDEHEYEQDVRHAEDPPADRAHEADRKPRADVEGDEPDDQEDRLARHVIEAVAHVDEVLCRRGGEDHQQTPDREEEGRCQQQVARSGRGADCGLAHDERSRSVCTAAAKRRPRSS